VSKIN